MLMDNICRHCISSKSKIGSEYVQCKELKTYRKARSWDLEKHGHWWSYRTGTLLTQQVKFLPMSEGSLPAMPVRWDQLQMQWDYALSTSLPLTVIGGFIQKEESWLFRLDIISWYSEGLNEPWRKEHEPKPVAFWDSLDRYEFATQALYLQPPLKDLVGFCWSASSNPSPIKY